MKYVNAIQKWTSPRISRFRLSFWVFTYKFDTDGYLTKFKARICVREDLQTPSKDDNYAAKLAAKTLRLMCAVIAIQP